MRFNRGIRNNVETNCKKILRFTDLAKYRLFGPYL